MANGTPAAASERRSTGSARVAERTTTAMLDHGTPSRRCARRNSSAIQVASCAAVPSTRTRTLPVSVSVSVPEGARDGAGEVRDARGAPSVASRAGTS